MVETSGALFAAHWRCAVSSGFLVDPGAPGAGTAPVYFYVAL